MVINTVMALLLALLVMSKSKSEGGDHRQVDKDAFPLSWNVLGPFPSGTREQGWDILSSYGGFEYLVETKESNLTTDWFASELVSGGYVTWTSTNSSGNNEVGPPPGPHNAIPWLFNSLSLGWTVLQHSYYYHASFILSPEEEGIYMGRFSRVVSFKIDKTVYPANNYGNILPTGEEEEGNPGSTFYLAAGRHDVYVQTQFDVRRDGSNIPPIAKFQGSISLLSPLRSSKWNSNLIIFHKKDTILPEVMEEEFVTKWGSVTIQNGYFSDVSGFSEEEEDFNIEEIEEEEDLEQGESYPTFKKQDDKRAELILDEGKSKEADRSWGFLDFFGVGRATQNGIIRKYLPYNPGEEGGNVKEERRRKGHGKHHRKGKGRDHRRARKTLPELGEGWKELQKLTILNAQTGEVIPTVLAVSYTIVLAPGQVFAIPFKFTDENDIAPPISIKAVLTMVDMDTLETFTVNLEDEGGGFTFKRKNWVDGKKEGFQITNLAYVKPPAKNCLLWNEKKCPVLVALHGAGVAPSSPFWINSVSEQDFAWVLFPSGRTPWGFDWHGPSFKNVEASVEGIMEISGGVPSGELENLKIRVDRLVVVGHSNGGQGAWWLSSHYPDTILASLPAAGYAKLQLYVPYALHGGYSFADPVARGLSEASISENDLDLYSSNLAGLPILARAGSLDMNVPPFHTRKLVRLVHEWSDTDSRAIKYVEDEGKGHWYDGVLNDGIAQDFLNSHLNPSTNPDLDLAPLPNPFTLTSLNPASTGSRGGISILQPSIPYRLSSIHVHRTESNHWSLKTINCRRFGFVRDKRQAGIKTWSIDQTVFNSPPEEGGLSYLNLGNGTWVLSNDLLWISRERNPTTYGPDFQVFSHAFKIVIPSSPLANHKFYRLVAEQISTMWFIYSRGSTQIIRDIDVLDGITAKYNLIVLGDPRYNSYTRARQRGGSSNLLQFHKDGGIQIKESTYNQPGTGALFLAPSPARTRLCLFVTGIDEDGLLRAAWSIPFRTGLQVADYTIYGHEYGDPSTGWMSKSYEDAGEELQKIRGKNKEPWRTKGVGGVLAQGFWSNFWEFEPSSGYLSGNNEMD